MAWLTRHGDGVRAALKVTPRAATSGVRGIEVDDAGQAYLAVRVNAPPEAGKANAALIRLLARRWRVPQRDLEVISGTSGRRKVLQIRGAPDALIARLEAIEGAREQRVGEA
ncbi:MAG TPA: DUF167 family protein [Geminicoccaceae bacterium]|nr:DUF167 family protein [Geminicoccaceae bacterium]